MARLGLLMLATLAGLYVILNLYGGERLREARSTRPAPESAAQISGGPLLAPARINPPTPALVQAASQTPARVREFAGPILVPSPQYAGSPQTRAPDTAPILQGALFQVTGSNVRFRAGPSTGDGVIGSLSGGSRVEVLGPTDTDWVQIRDTQGRTGFMSRQFLAPAVP